jgi:pilus assembly protein Flp/PilA
MLQKFYTKARNLFVRKEGATMVEYGLMVALIAVVCITAVTLLGGNLSTMFDGIATTIGAVPTAP